MYWIWIEWQFDTMELGSRWNECNDWTAEMITLAQGGPIRGKMMYWIWLEWQFDTMELVRRWNDCNNWTVEMITLAQGVTF